MAGLSERPTRPGRERPTTRPANLPNLLPRPERPRRDLDANGPAGIRGADVRARYEGRAARLSPALEPRADLGPARQEPAGRSLARSLAEREPDARRRSRRTGRCARRAQADRRGGGALPRGARR